MLKKILISIIAVCAYEDNYITDIELIKDGEGLKQCMYQDDMGIKRICYGYNLQKRGA